jgi:hypothetical protein
MDAVMTTTHDEFWTSLMRRLRGCGRPAPQTPAQADADYDAAGQAPLSGDQIDAIIRGALQATRATPPATLTTEEGPPPARISIRSRRIVRSTMGLAAAMALAAVLLWAFSASNGPAWADVVGRLASVRNVTFWIEPRYVSADGRPGHLPWFREYHQDPDLMRREYYGAYDKDNARKPLTPPYSEAPKPPDQTGPLPLREYQIRKIAGNEQQWYYVFPQERRATHHVTIGSPHERTYQVQDWWNRLKDIQASETHRVGEEVLRGNAVVVFEAGGVEKFWGYAAEPGTVTKLRVWVDKATALPVRVQFVGNYPDGSSVDQTMEDMRWDLDLPGDFFTPPTDYVVTENRTNIYLPPGTRLKAGVTFRLYDEKGFEIYNQSQVEAVTFLQVSPQGIVGRVDLMPPNELKNRWQKIWPRIQGKLYFDFNGELVEKLDIWHTHTFPWNIDVSRLALTREQFAQRYLDMPR